MLNKAYRGVGRCSLDTIRRLCLYMRSLKELRSRDVEVISSDELSALLKISSSQFRKDLSYFGRFGQRGVGYKVDGLIKEISGILGIDRTRKMALAGVGKLGGYLLRLAVFRQCNLEIVAAFDIDDRKIGSEVNGVKVEHISRMEEVLQKRGVEVGLICVPPEHAQEIADILVRAGIKAIVNFSPIYLKAINGSYVSNIDISTEIMMLVYMLDLGMSKAT